MALQLSAPFDTPFGITIQGTYWRWVGLQADMVRGAASVVLRPFASRAAAFAVPPASPVGPDRQYALTGVDLYTALPAAVVDGLNDSIYAYIRARDDFFKDAVDS